MAPAPIKKTEEQSIGGSKKKSSLSTLPLLLIALAFIAGIIGGVVGAKIYPTRVTSLDTASQIKIATSQSELISTIAKEMSPSVVSINVESSVSGGYFYEDSTETSAGTGIIISSDGYIITNRHVIPENVSSVAVTTNDGKRYDDVAVVARDTRSSMDIAFLKINNVSDLQPAKLGDSSTMVVGDGVVAIGYALGEFQNTVTSGIISGLGRPLIASDGSDGGEALTNLFQTDAAINPGNSGGPLVNMSGEVIGINTAVAGDAENIGFSIPINDVKPQIESILRSGKLEIPYLGVRYVMVTEAIAQRFGLALDSGAWLKAGTDAQAVMNDSPADKAGLKEGDIIFKVNGEEVTVDMPLASVLSKYKIGDELEITYNRDGKEQTTKATLEAAPES
jgi:serine protease Do